MASNAQPAFAWHVHKRHCAGCLSGGGDTHELEAHARRAALVAVGSRTIEGYCTGGTRLTVGARPWCDVRAVDSNAQPEFVWHARERLCAGCLSGGGKSRELAARARCAALTAIGLRVVEGHRTGGRPLSFGARPWCDVRAVASNTQPWCDVRAVASNTQPAFAWHANERHCAGNLYGGGKTRELAARARRAALPAICLRAAKWYCTYGRPLSFGARPWCDVRAVASNTQLAFAWHANKRHCAGCLSGGGQRRKLEARARRVTLVVIDPRTIEGYCTGGMPLSFGARPWCDVRAVASNVQPAFVRHACKRYCAGCLSGGGKIRKLAARARCAALTAIDLRDIKRHRTGGMPLSFDVQYRGATCELWPST